MGRERDHELDIEMRSWIEGGETEGWRAKQRDRSRRKQKRDAEVDKEMKRGKEGKVTEQINRVPDRMIGKEGEGWRN